MRWKHVTDCLGRAGALAVPGAALVATSLLTTSLVTTAGATSYGSRATGPASAFGVSATGLVNVPQTPRVYTLSDPRSKSLVALPPNPLFTLKVTHTSAAPARSRASVAGLEVAEAALSARLITADCAGGHATAHLVEASLAGRRLADDPPPNSTLTVPVPGVGTASVVLDKQVRNADGSLTVTAVEVTLALATGGSQTADISSATCSAADTADPPAPGDVPVTG